jgi:hypothetical protein
MKTKILAAVLIAASAAIAAPAFASGYGPAPFYNPTIGAPASQRGPSEQTVAAEEASNSASNSAYGGVNEQTTQSASQASISATSSLYRHH